jgi:hypothetical protein
VEESGRERVGGESARRCERVYGRPPLVGALRPPRCALRGNAHRVEDKDGKRERVEVGLWGPVRLEIRGVLAEDEEEEEAADRGDGACAAAVEGWSHDADASADEEDEDPRDGTFQRVEHRRGEREEGGGTARWLARSIHHHVEHEHGEALRGADGDDAERRLV